MLHCSCKVAVQKKYHNALVANCLIRRLLHKNAKENMDHF